MEDYFSIGELSRYQNISKQTLIFYDKLGLFQPAYVDPNNGYRYYTARQLDELDTILILKKSGLSLQRIKELLEHYTTESSQKVLREQLGAIDRQMEELRLLRSRLSQRCSQLEDANLHKGSRPGWKCWRSSTYSPGRWRPPTPCGKSALPPSSALPRRFKRSCPSSSKAGCGCPWSAFWQSATQRRPRPSCPLRKPAGRGTSSGCMGVVRHPVPPGGLPLHWRHV